MKKLIIMPPYGTYGDSFSMVGLIYFSLKYYDQVYFEVIPSHVFTYFSNYFAHDPLFNKRIFLTTQPEALINNGTYGEYHVCNTSTDDWLSAKTDCADLKNIDKEFYFNDLNPMYNKLDIPEQYKCCPNKHIPNTTMAINHIFYYELVGLNNSVRMDYFNYERNLDLENETKASILRGMPPNCKYNIVNDPIGRANQLVPYIKNGYPTININYIAPLPGYLTSLVEGAETIHFIEGCNVNFFYHCQYKNIFEYDKKIYFHVWIRNRNWDNENMRLDYAWKMMAFPKLDNWEFIFDEDHARRI